LPVKKIVYHPAMRIFIESPAFAVGAGFIPARSSIRAGLLAGINPAPTRKKYHSNRMMAPNVLANTSGTQHQLLERLL
jgi:hypothetical protein